MYRTRVKGQGHLQEQGQGNVQRQRQGYGQGHAQGMGQGQGKGQALLCHFHGRRTVWACFLQGSNNSNLWMPPPSGTQLSTSTTSTAGPQANKKPPQKRMSRAMLNGKADGPASKRRKSDSHPEFLSASMIDGLKDTLEPRAAPMPVTRSTDEHTQSGRTQGGKESQVVHALPETGPHRNRRLAFVGALYWCVFIDLT